MSDEIDSTKAEEERIQRAMNRKARSSMVVKPTNSITHDYSAPTPTYSQKPKPLNAPPEKPKPLTAPTEKPKPIEKPKPTATHTTTQTQPTGGARSAEIENLQLRKRTILGTIATTRRDLDDVRAEIAKLKNKEAELVSLLEKREQSVHQLTQEIEELEKREKDHSEDIKRQKEDEKAKRLKEEIERRRQEEVEEERKRIEEEERKLLNPQPVYSPRSEDDINDDGLNAEEQRIMRAMSRPGKGGGISAARVSAVKPANPPSKHAMSDAEKHRIAEENRKKEEEQRAEKERELQQKIAHLQASGGVKKTFISAQVYDFDADVKFLSDFTQFEEIPITTPMDNNFTFSVTFNVTPGPHFYLFKINGKTEINKHLPTGLAPNGLLMNKVDC